MAEGWSKGGRRPGARAALDRSRPSAQLSHLSTWHPHPHAWRTEEGAAQAPTTGAGPPSHVIPLPACCQSKRSASRCDHKITISLAILPVTQLIPKQLFRRPKRSAAQFGDGRGLSCSASTAKRERPGGGRCWRTGGRATKHN